MANFLDDDTLNKLRALSREAVPATPAAPAAGDSSDAHEVIASAASQHGVDPAFLLGLAKLETQVGAKAIGDTNNLFNVKDFSGKGTRAYDKAEGSNDAYRRYGSYEESAADLVGLLKRKYPQALEAQTPEEFAKALKAGGYATDKDYVAKLTKAIEAAGGKASAAPRAPRGAKTPSWFDDTPEEIESARMNEGALDRASRVLKDPDGGVLPAVGSLIASAMPRGDRDRGAGGYFKDTVVDVARGVSGLGESVVGLGNLVSAGALGALMDKAGYDPKATDQFLTGFYSTDRAAANKQVDDAKGFVDTLGALTTNPSALLGTVVQSLIPMIGSGAAAGAFVRRSLPSVTAAAEELVKAGTLKQSQVAGYISEQIGKKAVASSAIGEGAMTAGSVAEQGRQAGSDYTTYAPAAVGAGILTAGISRASGAVGRKLGLGDLDADIAAAGAGGRVANTSSGNFVVRGLKSGTKEAGLEEIPQSVQESYAGNLAEGKPLDDEAAGKAAAIGGLSAFAQSGAHAAVFNRKQEELSNAALDDIQKAPDVDTAIRSQLNAAGPSIPVQDIVNQVTGVSEANKANLSREAFFTKEEEMRQREANLRALQEKMDTPDPVAEAADAKRLTALQEKVDADAAAVAERNAKTGMPYPVAQPAPKNEIQWVDTTPIRNQDQARTNLQAMRERASDFGVNGNDLVLAPHPTEMGAFAIRVAPGRDPQTSRVVATATEPTTFKPTPLKPEQRTSPVLPESMSLPNSEMPRATTRDRLEAKQAEVDQRRLAAGLPTGASSKTPGVKPEAPASSESKVIYADKIPMDDREAKLRLVVLKDMLKNEGGDPNSLAIVPHPTTEGKFAIASLDKPASLSTEPRAPAEPKGEKVLSSVQLYVAATRKTNTDAARAFVKAYDSGRINDADVEQALQVAQYNAETMKAPVLTLQPDGSIGIVGVPQYRTRQGTQEQKAPETEVVDRTTAPPAPPVPPTPEKPGASTLVQDLTGKATFAEKVPVESNRAEVRKANDAASVVHLAKALRTSNNLFFRRIGQLLSKVTAYEHLALPGALAKKTWAGQYSGGLRQMKMAPLYAGDEHTNAHEAVHALVVNAMFRPTAAQAPYVAEMNRTYRLAMEAAKKAGTDTFTRGGKTYKWYGFTNVDEFVAEAFTNPNFQEMLSKLTLQSKPNVSLFSHFVEVVAKLLGLSGGMHNALLRTIALGEHIAQQRIAEDKARNTPSQATAPGGAPQRTDVIGAGEAEETAPKFYSDIPNESWLQGKINYAVSAPRSKYGVPKMSSVTGYFSTSRVMIPARWVSELKGENGEQDNVRTKDLDAIRKILRDTGAMPLTESGKEYVPYIEVGYDGVPWVSEGNHRLMAAVAEGWDYIPVEVRYFDGGQRRAGKWRPDNLLEITQRHAENALPTVSGRGEDEEVTPTPATPVNDTVAERIASVETRSPLVNNLMTATASAMMTNQSGQFNAIHRAIATQFHKAKLNPYFGKVWERLQTFIQDTASFAVAAERKARLLFPDTSSISAIWRGGLTPTENALIGRMLADGTLHEGVNPATGEDWTDDELLDTKRNKDGEVAQNPKTGEAWTAAEIRDVLRANPFVGKVWTNKELLERYGANKREADAYHQAREAIYQSLDDAAKVQMLEAARRRGVELPRGGVTLARMSTDPTYTSLKVHDLLVAELDKMIDQEGLGADGNPTKRASELIGLRSNIKEVSGQIGGLKKAGYFPLMRFGNVGVTVKSPEGEVVYYEEVDNQAEAKKLMARLRQDMPGNTVSYGNKAKLSTLGNQGITPETVEMFAKLAGIEEEEGMKTYLDHVANNRSTIQRLQKRHGTEGYSTDATRIVGNFITGNARRTSKTLNMRLVNDAMSAKELNGNAHDEARELIDTVMNPKGNNPKLNAFIFASFLGGSVASGVVNAFQTVMQTLPHLSQYGAAKALGVMKTASAETLTYLRTKKASSPELQAALDKAQAEGVLDPNEIYSLMATASSATGGNELLKDSRASAKISAALKTWGYTFQAAESFNRTMAFISAYQMAQKMTEEQLLHAANGDETKANAVDFAIDTVRQTQGVFNIGNRPNWARSSVGATVFTFKQFSINYIEWMVRMAKAGPTGRKGVAVALGALMLMAGSSGLPFEEDLEDLFDTLGHMAGYATNSKAWRKELLRDTFGETLGEILDRGITSQMGLDMSGRFSLANLIPGTRLLDPAKKDKAGELTEVGGVAVAAAAHMVQGLGALAAGDYRQAILLNAPVALQNAIRGYEGAVSGEYRDAKNRKVADVTAAEAAIKAIGFQPQVVAEGADRRSAAMADLELYKWKKASLADRYAEAMRDRDPAAMAEIREEVRTWNADNPGMKVELSLSAIASKVRAMRLSSDERFIKQAPKAMRQELREALLQ